MYIVDIKNGNFTTRIHGADTKLASGQITKGINTIDSFTFTMFPDNAGFQFVNEFTTLVYVTNTRTNSVDFVGRVLYAETSMDESGLIKKSVTCESVAGYLCDSVQTYVDTQNWTVAGMLQHLIDCHNSQVEPEKRFKIGTVTATDANDNLYQGIQRVNTWDAINDKLIDKIGGELQFRIADDGIYIDYLDKIGTVKSTAIELSVNMKSITREQNPTSFITRLIPLGSKQTIDGEETEHRLDISTVNDGKNYIDDETAIEKYGIHVGVVEFDDVNIPSVLMTKGKAFLAEKNKVQVKYSITALELFLLGLTMHEFDVGNWHPIRNKLIGIDDTARIIKKSIDICEEYKSTIEVGDNFKSLSDIQREQADIIQSTVNDFNDLQISTNNSITEIRNTVSEQKTSILESCNAIVMSAMKSYVETSSYEEFKKTLEAELGIWAEGIYASVSKTEESISKVDGDLQSKYNTITKFLNFDTNGLQIGSVNEEGKVSPNKVVIDDDEIAIKVNNMAVQQFLADGSALIPILKITTMLNLLGLQFTEDKTTINCDYIGGVS